MKRNEISVHSITILSIALFYIWTSITAVITFQLNSYLEILSLSLMFLSIFILFIYLFFRDTLKTKIEINVYNISFSFIVLFILIIFHNSPLEYSLDYLRTYPLLESENGLGWNLDTVFHVSIIQSIINFGYPSTGQDGVPLMGYHVLSHYVDALMIKTIGLEPFDSYSLMYYFKSFLFLISVLYFISKVVKNNSISVFLFSILIFMPITIAHWQGVFSHGLWFASIIIIFSSIYLFNILTSSDKISIKQYISIFFLIIIIALCKINTGFMYAVFIGFFILLKEYKSINIYILGSLWVVFFLVYQSFMTIDNSTIINFKNLSFENIYNYITTPSMFYYDALSSIYISLVCLLALGYIFKEKINIIALISAITTFIVLIFVTVLFNFLKADIFFFQYGFYSILILFIFQSIFYNVELAKTVIIKNSIQFRFIQISIISISIFISSIYYLPKSNILNLNSIYSTVKDINTRSFMEINKLLPTEGKISLKILANEKFPTKFKRTLFDLRNDMYAFMKNEKITKNNTLLFIPKNFFIKKISQYQKGKLSWSFGNGLYMYSIFGTPLIYGIESFKHTRYGQIVYNKSSTYKHRINFNEACKKHSFDNIIALNSFTKNKFILHRCNSNTK